MATTPRQKGLTVAEMVNMFHDYNQGKNKRLATSKAYQSHLRHFVNFIGPEKSIKTLNELDIDRYRSDLGKRGLADVSINSYLRAVKVMLRWAGRKKLIKNVPEVEFILLDATRPKTSLSATELEKLVEAASQERGFILQLRAGAIVRLLYATGLRASELIGADWSAFHHLEVEGVQAHILVIEGAKRGGLRRLVVNESVWDAVNSYRTALAGRWGGRQLEPLFTSDKGGRLSRSGLHHILLRLQKRCGSEAGSIHANAHKFRRTFAADWLEKSQGRELDTLMELGGWSDVELIKKHYAAYQDATLVKAYRRNGQM